MTNNRRAAVRSLAFLERFGVCSVLMAEGTAHLDKGCSVQHARGFAAEAGSRDQSKGSFGAGTTG